MIRAPITRRRSLVLAIAAAAEAMSARASSALFTGHRAGTCGSELGLDPDLEKKIDEAVRTGKLDNLHAVVVLKSDRVVLERYYEGTDQFWGMPIGSVKFGPDVKHDLRSSSKSVVGLLYGIALSEGKVPGLDEILIDHFPRLRDLARDVKLRRVKVKHALTMTMGMDWPEDGVSYANARNAEVEMYMATDQFRYVFSHRIVTEPGSVWTYSGGATAILGHLIAQGTGLPLFDYARKRLFEPLSIDDVEWVGGSDGEVAAASGLRMCPMDFAKIGQLVLKQGRWGGKEIVPRQWLISSFTPCVHIDEETDYGYQWYLIGKLPEHHWIAARGNGGQYLTIIPDLNLVVAIMAGGYNKGGGPSAAALKDYILPALK